MSFKIDANISNTTYNKAVTLDDGTKYTNSIYTVKNPEEGNQNPVRDKEKVGEKSEQYLRELISKYANEYTITKGTKRDYSTGEDIPVYYITVKKDIDLKGVKKDLGIRAGIIYQYNDQEKYKTYGTLNNGSYVEDGPMQNETIVIPVSELGYTHDERSFLERLADLF